MPFKARLLMGPVRMYRIYGTFPFAWLFHILLTLLTSYQLIYTNHLVHDYSREQRIAFFKFIQNDDIEADEFFYDRITPFYSLDDFSKQIRTGLDFYRDIECDPVEEKATNLQKYEQLTETGPSLFNGQSNSYYPHMCPCGLYDIDDSDKERAKSDCIVPEKEQGIKYPKTCQ